MQDEKAASSPFVVAVCVVGLVTVAAMALYYRSRAADFESKWREAVAAASVPAPVREVPKAGQPSLGTPAARREATQAPLPAQTRESARDTSQPVPSATNSWLVGRDSENRTSLRRRGEAWISVLNTNDPVRYEAIQKRRQEVKEGADAAYAEATDFFFNRDISRMSETDLEEYNLMITLLEDTRALTLQLQTGVPTDQRWQTFSAVRSNMVALTPLLSNERDRELYDVAIAMGHSATDAVSMVTYVNQIASNTSLRVIFPDLLHRGSGGAPPGPRP